MTAARQVAVIAYRRSAIGLELCLTRRTDSTRWGIPKGYIDPGDTPEQAALTEALEEAGLKGQIIGAAIGTYEYTKWKNPVTVAVYLMDVSDEQERWEEMRFRERRWCSTADAAVLLASHPIRPLWSRVAHSLPALGG
jgi:8-oxo-dGTP pyrophosphatase MutT (NUDIX family)